MKKYNKIFFLKDKHLKYNENFKIPAEMHLKAYIIHIKL